MIILDTNVVSEPLKPSPDPSVLNWLDAHDPATFYITTINLAELIAGVEAMPLGRRREALEQALSRQVTALFERRILDFDAKAAEAFAKVASGAQAQGNPIGFADGAIAAIARARGFAVATRNVRDFRGAGIEIIDPWAS